MSEFKYYNIDDEPFEIKGVFKSGGRYRRMPEEIAKSVSEGVYNLHTNTAGGRVRFVTDSDTVLVEVKMDGIGRMSHFAFTGSAGLDLYADGEYFGTFKGDMSKVTEGFSSEVNLPGRKKRCITINMPLYSNLISMKIGLNVDAFLEKAPAYKYEKPVVYYGSSITQGGCASRPGNSYQAIISRILDNDYINLGFSGNAKAEDEIADYIAGLDMSVFVYDYDHNAPTPEHLEATHEKMFKKFREKQPLTPVIMMSRPKYHLTDEEIKRLEIIKKTYNNAVKSGDKNVYLLTGPEMIDDFVIECATVDNCHPNDSGFVCMAKALLPMLKNCLEQSK